MTTELNESLPPSRIPYVKLFVRAKKGIGPFLHVYQRLFSPVELTDVFAQMESEDMLLKVNINPAGYGFIRRLGKAEISELRQSTKGVNE